ncbi:hypothetical protein F4677DRAFT_435897 [Hypoxylon crocopeplum]|nr:hypothetical protein F4677DRAFT_435897 [Hypoxylon crocopeplum]
MASLNDTGRVFKLKSHFENGAWVQNSSQTGGLDEHENRVIHDGLGRSLGDVERRRIDGMKSTPPIPPRPRRNNDQSENYSQPAYQDGKAKYDGKIVAWEVQNVSKQPPDIYPHESDVRVLEEQSKKVHRRSRELDGQHQDAELKIRNLKDKIYEFQEKNSNLIAAGSAQKELIAELREDIEALRSELAREKHREEALRRDLEESRQREHSIRRQLEAAEEAATELRRESAAREFELQQKLHAAEMDRAPHENQAVRRQQDHRVQNYELEPHRDFGMQSQPIHVFQVRDERDAELIRQQRSENDKLTLERDHLCERNRKLEERYERSRKEEKRQARGIAMKNKNRL